MERSTTASALIDPAIARAILVYVADVVVYTTEHCPFCVRAKALLDARGVAYTEVNLERDPDGRAELVRKTGMMTFPQVIIDGTLVGGFQETLAADRSGQLAELLDRAA
jgi:glutaredoxin 3